MRGLDRAGGELDDALVVPRARALLVLRGRQAEQEHGRDAERGGLARPPRRRAEIERWSMPGMLGIGTRPSMPWRTNIGYTRCAADSSVSRTRPRSRPVLRRRRMRVAGNTLAA